MEGWLAQVVFIHSFIHSSYAASRVHKTSCSFSTRGTTVRRVRTHIRTHACVFCPFFPVRAYRPPSRRRHRQRRHRRGYRQGFRTRTP